jgi:hypothetical protein
MPRNKDAIIYRASTHHQLLDELYHGNVPIKKFTENKVFIFNINSINEILNMGDELIFIKRRKRQAVLQLFEFLSFLRSEERTMTISQRTFQRYFSKNYYKAFMELLIKKGYITPIPDPITGLYYLKDEFSRKFYINRSKLNDDPAIIMFPDGEQKKVDYTRCDERMDEYLDKHPKFVYTILNAEIDVEKAIMAEVEYCFENNQEKLIAHRLRAILNLSNERYIHKGGKVNRIFTSLTNLSRVSRKFLMIDGLPFLDVDVKQCQPNLLLSYLSDNPFVFDQTYQDDLEANVFYERLVGLTGSFRTKDSGNKEVFMTLDRDLAKIQLYKSIFFRFNEGNLVNQKFRELYPLTWISLKRIHKMKGNVKLAGLLQNHEAEIFRSIPPLEHSVGYHLLFDSIYFTSPHDLPVVYHHLKDEFKNRGVDVGLTFCGELLNYNPETDEYYVVRDDEKVVVYRPGDDYKMVG